MNIGRLPSYEWFCEEFGDGFITDTYTSVRDAEGYGDHFGSLTELQEKAYEGDERWERWDKDVNPGSVMAQYLELFWAMHRDDFWEQVME